MLALNVETTGLEELNPPEDGWDQGLVTDEVLEN